MFARDILDLREGMTAELRHRPSGDRHSPSHRGTKPWGAKPRVVRGANRQCRIYAPFAVPSHLLHQEPVKLQVGDISATLLVGTPEVSLTNLNLNDRLFVCEALTTVQMHRTGSDTLRLSSFLSNANHHFGGQL